VQLAATTVSHEQTSRHIFLSRPCLNGSAGPEDCKCFRFRSPFLKDPHGVGTARGEHSRRVATAHLGFDFARRPGHTRRSIFLSKAVHFEAPPSAAACWGLPRGSGGVPPPAFHPHTPTKRAWIKFPKVSINGGYSALVVNMWLMNRGATCDSSSLPVGTTHA
jgi:hypothetical protein